MRSFFSAVARAIPFTSASFRSTDVESGLSELRQTMVMVPEYITTTLNGIVTLTVSNTSLQIVNGTATGFSIQFPSALSLLKGMKYEIVNNSSHPVSVKDGAGNEIISVAQTSIGYFTLHDNSSIAGGWVSWEIFVGVASGIVNYKISDETPFTTTSTSDVVIPGFSVTPEAGTYAIWYNASNLYTSSPRTPYWTFYKAGTALIDSQRSQDTTRSNQTIPASTMSTAQFNGGESLDVRIRADPAGGSLTVNARTLVLIRLGT